MEPPQNAEVASRDISGPSRGNKVAKLMRRTVKEMKISVQNFTQFFKKGFLGFELQLSRGGWSKEGSDCVYGTYYLGYPKKGP